MADTPGPGRAGGGDGAPDGVAGGRRVVLPDGRALIVRAARPSDVGGLELLYAGLSSDDVHLRFFAMYHPPATFFEHLANAAAEGGYALVAVVDDPCERIVAEADYFLLANGDGELSITVAGDWRGWLGPYMLDALAEAAAARGVPNLQAEILVENRRMLALVRRRGFATVDGTDFSTVRVVMGTATPTPTWPKVHDRPRVLAEVPGGRWRAERAARDAGMQVIVCPGPRPGRDAHCPVLEGRTCPLAEGADVIVCALPSGYGRSDEVRAAHAVVHPGIPRLVEGQQRGDGAVALTPGMNADDLVSLLRRVLADRSPG